MNVHRVFVVGALVASTISGLSLPSSADPRREPHRAKSGACAPEFHVDPEVRELHASGLPATVSLSARVGVRKGWDGNVALSVKGPPGKVTGVISPATLTFDRTTRERRATVTVTAAKGTGAALLKVGDFGLWFGGSGAWVPDGPGG